MTVPAAVDPGLQAERTVLAWWRTALTAAVAGGLILREALEQSAHPGLVVVGAVALGVLLLVAARRVLALQHRSTDPVAPGRHVTAAVVVAAVTLQAVALVLLAA